MRDFLKLVFVMVVTSFGLSARAQCDANFLPALFHPVTGEVVNFFYWGSISPNLTWDYTLDFGNGYSTSSTSFPAAGVSLGNTTYTLPGTYTVTLTVFDVACTTSTTANVVVASGGSTCPQATFTEMPRVSFCVNKSNIISGGIQKTYNLNIPTGGAPFHHVVWDMGDGTTIPSTSSSITYSYIDPGVYFVQAEVFYGAAPPYCSDFANGVLTGITPAATQDFYMTTVHDADPEFVLSPAAPVAGDPVSIIYTGDYSILPPANINFWNYSLSIDGSISTGPITYGMTIPPGIASISSGPHTIELTVYAYNSCRQKNTISFNVSPDDCDTCNSFKPIPGKTYWLSAWVQEENGTTQIPTHTDVSITLGFVNGTPVSKTLLPTGEIIDGWQRIAGEFTIPAGTTDLEVKLNAGNQLTYFDDIRIHPFNGSMKSYVYDGQTFWLMSELDDNNYATFYEYDAEGGLIRIKKETSGGIVTIQETRSSTIKVSTP